MSDSVEEALAATTARRDQLAGRLDELAAAETKAVEDVRAQVERLEERRATLDRSISGANSRVLKLREGHDASLRLIDHAKKGAQLAVRLVLSFAALLGLLMVATGDSDLTDGTRGWLTLAALGVEAGVVWFLGDFLDKSELTR